MESIAPVNILLVEDSEDDAVLLENHLRFQGLRFDLKRVEVAE